MFTVSPPPPYLYLEFEIHQWRHRHERNPRCTWIDVDVLDDGVRVAVKVTSALSPLLS